MLLLNKYIGFDIDCKKIVKLVDLHRFIGFPR